MRTEGGKMLSIQTEDIELLEEPHQFYEEVLIPFIRNAKEQMIFSALYLGTGSLEKKLIEEIDQALSDTINRPNLQVSLIFDYSRSQRRVGSVSTLDLLTPLIQRHGANRIKVYLYELPSLRTTVCRLLPWQWREILGVYHCKFAVSDQTVCLTGANLSHEYFTTRQDRYWIVKNESGSRIASFLRQFTDIVGSDSSILLENNTLQDPIVGKTTACNSALRNLIMMSNGDDGLGKMSSLVSSSDDHVKLVEGEVTDRHTNASCAPLIQHSELGIFGEENALCRLIKDLAASLTTTSTSSSSPPCSISLQVATPYTNFPTSLLHQFLSFAEHGGNVEIIGPSHSAHGFASGTGFKKYIPELHREALMSTLQDALKQPNQAPMNWQDYFSFSAYTRSGWTYHSKGLWWQREYVDTDGMKNDDNTDSSNTIRDFQSGCYIGSSNFGIRSWARDFELGFLFSTTTASTTNGKCEEETICSSGNSDRIGNTSIFVRDFENLKRYTLADKQTKTVVVNTVSLNRSSGSSGGNNISWLRTIARLVKSVL